MRDLMVSIGQRNQRAALDHEERRLADGIRRAMVDVVDAEAEHLAGQIERADLASSVAQNLIGARRSRHDLINVIGRLSLAEDFLVARIGNRHAYGLKRARAGLVRGPKTHEAGRQDFDDLGQAGRVKAAPHYQLDAANVQAVSSRTAKSLNAAT